jgi:hypothetical protein
MRSGPFIIEKVLIFLVQLKKDIKTRRPIIQFETRNFGHHCQYTVKKCKIGFTLLTSMTDMDRK